MNGQFGRLNKTRERERWDTIKILKRLSEKLFSPQIPLSNLVKSYRVPGRF